MPVDPRIQAALDAPFGQGRDLIASIRPKRGYAAAPGSGPAGETCHSCRYICGVKGNEYASGCAIAKRRGPLGGKIPISTSSPACSRWEARQ